MERNALGMNRVLVLLALSACTGPNEAISVVEPPLLSHITEGNFHLRVEAVASTDISGAADPPIIYYYLVNGSQTRTVNINPGLFRISVRTKGGEPVTPEIFSHPAAAAWGTPGLRCLHALSWGKPLT